MKKISIILAAASVLVVGGVYAGWSYSQGAVSAADDDIGVVMTSESTTSAKGALDVHTSSSKFEIDDIVDDGVAYRPVLVLKNAPTVTFTPSAGADATVLESGINLKWSISLCEEHSTWKYDSTFSNQEPDENIFRISSSTFDVPTPVKSGNDFVYTIPTADILAAVELTLTDPNDDGNFDDAILLDTKAKFDSFKDDLMSGAHFVLHIEEAI